MAAALARVCLADWLPIYGVMINHNFQNVIALMYTDETQFTMGREICKFKTGSLLVFLPSFLGPDRPTNDSAALCYLR